MSDKQPLVGPPAGYNQGAPVGAPPPYQQPPGPYNQPPQYGGPQYPPPNPPPQYPQYQAAGPAPAQTTNIVVTNQPANNTRVVYQRRYGNGDHYLVLSIIVSICCFIFAGWPSLICTIPAIFFAISAQDAEARGDEVTMRKNAQTALILDICGMVFGFFFYCFVVGMLTWRVILINNINNNYPYNN
jgi:hypothetical protein